jgi:hypothetical protein
MGGFLMKSNSLKRMLASAALVLILILTSCEYSGERSPGHSATAPSEREPSDQTSLPVPLREAPSADGGGSNGGENREERRLFCKHSDPLEFHGSMENPKAFTLNGNLIGGIVPHHMTAATLISGFFKSAADSGAEYDTVVIIAPNHAGETEDIIVSFKNWQVWDAVYCDRDIVERVSGRIPNITENDDRMEDEHAVAVLIPYIGHYLPEAKVAAFLVNKRMTLETVYNFAKILSEEIILSGKRALLIASIDFSHFLPTHRAAENDRITEAAILERNYAKIHRFSDEYADSPQSLNAFLMYLEITGPNNIEILYNTDASEFLGESLYETTSYFVIAAYE